MPTMRPFDPFTPTGPPSQDLLERYVRGELHAAERHALELRMEEDPLLREAVEGLGMPNALAGLSPLADHRPRTVRWGPRLFGAGLLIAAGWVAALLWVREEPNAAPAPIAQQQLEQPFAADSVIAVIEQEIILTEPLNATERIGHDPVQRAPMTVRDTVMAQPIDRRDSSPTALTIPPPVPAPREAPPRTRSNRQLAYVHDLKLVHPKELYEPVPLLTEPSGIPANFADGNDMRERTGPPRTMRYLDYMDVALGRFARNDERGCLQDLVHLLGQYPNDVNGRFYAGLCCYNLGLPERAMGYLEAVVNDPLDTFQEEAYWYLALSTERALGMEAAEALYRNVAEGGGFYAPRAVAKLTP